MIKTNLFRRPGLKNKRRPFSLSRTQFGVWMLVIFCSYFYLLSVKKPNWTGKNDLEPNNSEQEISLTKSVVILSGISLATASIGTVLDGVKIRKGVNHVNKLLETKGYSLSRLQYIALALFTEVAYLIAMTNQQNFPELDEWLLLFFGVSSGAYLCFKVINAR